MRGTMKILRHSVYAELNGNLSYNSSNVPVYDEKKHVGDTDQIFVLLSTQQETPTDDNDCTFITRSSIDIEIIAKTEFEVSKDMIDDVSDLVQNLLLPTKGTLGFSSPSGWQFQNPRFESSFTQNLAISETQSILRKICKFVCEIVEQN